MPRDYILIDKTEEDYASDDTLYCEELIENWDVIIKERKRRLTRQYAFIIPDDDEDEQPQRRRRINYRQRLRRRMTRLGRIVANDNNRNLVQWVFNNPYNEVPLVELDHNYNEEEENVNLPERIPNLHFQYPENINSEHNIIPTDDEDEGYIPTANDILTSIVINNNNNNN